ncbi:MAG TPA: GntR family transcriptional regulator [Candidatus Aminicenantes bacterium]|nr:GntR family transcriptional regulator [Candidatus Aminicenantes bacterium]HRY65831.1 GntR family transcriptional regulator [Candidatus Aminicenantes bacterium]HRZ72843.1 GntR family transcriptional regulator [Candidatus Aminicenantes bacterium]
MVYDYLRDQIRSGELKPGGSINMDRTAKSLGISKTPLREALIKLETENFVKIIPWKGVIVNTVELKDFEQCYQVIGSLERSAMLAAGPRLKEFDIRRLEILDDEMSACLAAKDFDGYYEKNLEFHNIYLTRAQNEALVDVIEIMKKRLYEFSRPMEFIPEWEEISLAEHRKLVEFLGQGRFQDAADYLENTIWSYAVQRPFIVRYYKFDHGPAAKG